MTSQGQRFRRRALRRGYKVDEVDVFLDRVEATLAGEAGSNAVSAQEVHDVVFRVRFGGYDEWQVDLQLDRIERQLTELEERGGGRAPEPRLTPGPDRLPPERQGPERMAPPPDRMVPDRMAPPPERGGPERMVPSPDLMGPPTIQVPPVPAMPVQGQAPSPAPGRSAVAPPPVPQREPTYGRYDEPPYESGYEAGRHGRADMTAEIRMPTDTGYGGPSGQPGPATGAFGGHTGGFGAQPDFSGHTGAYAPGGGGPSLTGDAARADQLRRTFQLRRFGSGYDRAQVDRLFDAVVAALANRGPNVTEAQLDPSQFALVPGGYFEAEVNAALREVRDLLTRRR